MFLITVVGCQCSLNVRLVAQIIVSTGPSFIQSVDDMTFRENNIHYTYALCTLTHRTDVLCGSVWLRGLIGDGKTFSLYCSPITDRYELRHTGSMPTPSYDLGPST